MSDNFEWSCTSMLKILLALLKLQFQSQQWLLLLLQALGVSKNGRLNKIALSFIANRNSWFSIPPYQFCNYCTWSLVETEHLYLVKPIFRNTNTCNTSNQLLTLILSVWRDFLMPLGWWHSLLKVDQLLLFSTCREQSRRESNQLVREGNKNR